jgi:hypothetical protein
LSEGDASSVHRSHACVGDGRIDGEVVEERGRVCVVARADSVEQPQTPALVLDIDL